MKRAYLFDNAGYFAGEGIVQIDPLETKAAGREIFIMPANSTEIEPLPEKDGFKIKWNGSAWVYEEIPDESVPEHAPTEEELKQQRLFELKGKLYQTDYKALKYAEGWLTEEEYAETKAERQAWRDEINQLENQKA